jgi:ribonuclease E
LLIRTEAEGISEELLIDDLEALLRQWEAIQQAAETSVPPVLLNRDEDFIHRILRDHMGPDLARVVVDDPAAVSRVGSFLGSEHGNVVVESHDESTELLEHYKINAAIRDALRPRVDLPSGGYVIIEPTEALTVIDVNSGSFTRSANARETVLWTNVEAAIEIARQLKLRNIGGVIIIDFIDMDSRRDQLQLLEHFTTATRDDSARPQIAQLTELGLVELTRKRQGQNIYELFARACPSCGGLGHVAVLPGKDLSPPLAAETGLVRSVASARSEVVSPGDTAANNGRRRRGGGRGRTSSEGDSPLVELTPESEAPQVSTEEAHEPAIARRQDPELIAVSMTDEQQEVYSWLGLNPALLLNEPPESDNVVVRVVRPGEDEAAVLEEARQQLAASAGRRRRRGSRGAGGRSVVRAEVTQPEPIPVSLKPEVDRSQPQEDAQPLMVEITPLESVSPATVVLDQEPVDELVESTQPAEDVEEPRRRRRRSSAPLSN